MPEQNLDILIRILTQEVGSEKAADIVKKVSENTQDAAKHTEKLTFHGREYHKLMVELDQLMPGLGEAIRGAFNPEAIGIVAAIIAIQMFVKYLEDAKKKAEDLAATNAQVWVAQKTAIDEATKAAREYTAATKQSVDAQDELKAKFEEQKKVLNAVLELQKTIQGGTMNKTDADKANLRLLYDERSGIGALAPGLSDKSRVSAGQYQTALASQDAAEAAGLNSNKDEGKLRAAAVLAGEFLKKTQGMDQFTPNINDPEGSMSGLFAVEQMRSQREDAQKTIDELAAFEKNKAIVEEHTETVARLKAELDKNIEAVKANAKSYEDLTRQIDTGNKVEKVHRQDEIIGGAGGLSSLVSGVGNNADILRHGGKLNADQVALNKAFTELMQSLNFNGPAIIQIFSILAGNQANQKAELAALTSQLKNQR